MQWYVSEHNTIWNYLQVKKPSILVQPQPPLLEEHSLISAQKKEKD